MNLKLIRLRARTIQVQQPGLAILFALLVLLTIPLLTFLLSGLKESGRSATGYDLAVSRYLHDPAAALSFCRSPCNLHFSGRLEAFSYLDTINAKIKHRTRVLDISLNKIALPLYFTP